MAFSSIESALEDLRLGKMLIVVDDEGRENEGDLVMAAEFATAESINFMITQGRGLVCSPMSRQKAMELGLGLLVEREKNTSPYSTPFTMSLDWRGDHNTGISAADRARTLNELAKDNAKGENFQRPGHIFPLIAKELGVLARDGHTEASIDLLKMAGLKDVAVICEILNPDGTMARVPELLTLSKEWGIKIITIHELINYRLKMNHSYSDQVCTRLPSREFQEGELYLYQDPRAEGVEHLAYVCKTNPSIRPLVRIHSECFTGDVLGSLRCDCGEQLKKSLQLIAEHGHGALVYLRQEGRGIGLKNKLRAYNIQDHHGKDTVEANVYLGHAPDERSYFPAALILHHLNMTNIDLITNNPQKIEEIEIWGIKVNERHSLPATITPFNQGYLRAKVEKMRHSQDVFPIPQGHQ